jgi:DNA-directed RNA polymerase specialized sigma24 family protein
VANRSRSVLRHRAVADRNPRKPPPGGPGALGLPERPAVVAALRRLPGQQREAIVLRYYADLSEAEAAAAMGISRGAVKSHAARGMAALRADLEHESRGDRATAGMSPVPRRSSRSAARAAAPPP